MMKPYAIDVSHHNKITSLDHAVLAGVVGLIQKASEGHSNVDPTFKARRVLAKQAGMEFGAYHFLRLGNGAAQADHFLEVVGDTTGVLLVLDYEDPTVPPGTAKDFMLRVKARTGALPTLYSYSAFLRGKEAQFASDKAFWSTARLWIAQYGPTVKMSVVVKSIWPTWWLWQFTGDGNGPEPHGFPGISTPLDVNTYDGSALKLREEWASVQIATRPRPEPVQIPTRKAPEPVQTTVWSWQEFFQKILRLR